MRGLMLVVCLWSVALLTPARASDPGELVTGVSQITSGGLSGPVHPLAGAWWPVAAGDDDATFPSLFALARDYGAGRVVILGHEGVATNTALLDNGVFMLNVMSWLDVAGTGQARYTTGHAEWANGSNLAGLAQLVAGAGMTLTALPGSVEPADLVGVSAVIIGNAWGDFTAVEIEAIRQWVDAGGGVLLLGLGWSWEPFHPGSSLEEYPMMQVAQPYSVRWLRNPVTDPTNQYDGSAIFHVFYPDITIAGLDDAIDVIETAHQDHGSGLRDALEDDAAVRFDFVRAHQTLAIPSTEFPGDHPERSQVFDVYAALMQSYPLDYSRALGFDAGLHPTAAWIRERAWRTWRDCLDLTPDRKAMMIALGLVAGPRLEVFEAFEVILLDNNHLDAAQWAVVDAHLELIPGDLYQGLRAISVTDALGDPPMPVGLSGLPHAVNIFGFDVGDFVANQFPPDVDAGWADVYSVVVAHEVNHVVDAVAIGGSPALAARRDLLIDQAGDDPLNYLRSMFPAGFFRTHPQEFFASIANQWLTDSAKTLQLGLTRFDDGRPDPINQALFFADVYSGGGGGTWFYTTDLQGNVTRSAVSVDRDASGLIDGLTVGFDLYHFQLDATGRVTDYVATTADLDADGVVGIVDFLMLLARWGPCPGVPEPCLGDLSGDGDVGMPDFLLLLGLWS